MTSLTQAIEQNEQMEKFNAALINFVFGCAKIYNDYMEKNFPNNSRDTFEIERGQRYVKIIKNGGGSRSVYCFVDKTNGDVLKSASWKAPAKGARGNIFAPDNGLSKMTWHGAAYLRH